MAGQVYEDGTRDCPACVLDEVTNPNRVRGALNTLCAPHERAVHAEAMSGLAQLEPFMKRQLKFTDWRVEHGDDLAA